VDEPRLPLSLEDDDTSSGKEWAVAALRELARQLGVMNDYYYPLIGAAEMLKNLKE